MKRLPADWSVVVTAEHGGNDVPPDLRPLFRDHGRELRSHRGWDPGTLNLARRLASRLRADVVASSRTRLLVDLNRSAHNPRVFSEITRVLPGPDRIVLLERFHRPHWEAARTALHRGVVDRGRVLHLGIHSFAPVLGGEVRRPDLALLYDPSRPRELKLAMAWSEALAVALPDRVVRRNNPYRGAADGMTTAFRRELPAGRYLGLEIEVNQKHVEKDGSFPAWVADALLGTLPDALPR